MQTLIIFILFLGPLIFFHELGHFLFARLFGVRVEVFSIGFGPKILKKKINDTEYAISVIPLGGYVKMFGDNPLEADNLSESDKKVSYTHKSKWAKFWIVFGGPFANFLLAFVIYFLLVMGGEKVPEPRIGIVDSSSKYYQIGFRTGDVLKKINDTDILSFDDLNLIDGEIEKISVYRNKNIVDLNLKMNSQEFLEELNTILKSTRAPIFATTKGDFYYLFDGSDFMVNKSLEQLIENIEGTQTFYLSKVSDIRVSDLSKLNFNKEDVVTLENVTKENFFSLLRENGFYQAELSIYNVNKGPASDAGLKKGDIILAVNDQDTKNFFDVQKLTQVGEGKEYLNYRVLSDNKVKLVKIKPQFDGEVSRIGVESSMLPFSLGLVESKTSSWTLGFTKALKRTADGIVKTTLGFKKLILGEVSIKNLGGPFAIASVAADSFNISISMFFRLMALISINLGLINLFPIPVLDGGHIVMLGVETIYGGPLPKRVLMRIQQVGVSLLLFLMFVAIFNDVSKFF